jgi:3-phenylpropionate/trans-cinnamate dioxygenase ferredoxin reductase subunit
VTGAADPGVVIVGAGFAAGEAAMKLRQFGYDRAITLVGAERHLPYHRPPLSKTYLSGAVAEDALLLRPASAYEKAEIGFRGGVAVDAIDRAAKRITLHGGDTLPYDRLVLATGGHARRLDCPGAALDGVLALRTLDDVAAIRDHMQPGARLVIIGGGYIGLEVAAVAIKQGVAVTVVEAAPRVLARVAGAEISAFYEKAHRDAGVTILTGASVTALTPAADAPGHVGGVALADGSELAADFVIAGVGLIPNDALARDAGLRVENGIWVDEYCRTEDESILAIGDCANHPSAFLGRRVRLESVPNAIEQARVAADTILGKMLPYAAIPWFWSDQYDLKLQAVGLADGHDQVVVRGSVAARSFLIFYLRAGVVIAADAVNKPGEFLVAKKLVGAVRTVDPGILGDTEKQLKEVLLF